MGGRLSLPGERPSEVRADFGWEQVPWGSWGEGTALGAGLSLTFLGLATLMGPQGDAASLVRVLGVPSRTPDAGAACLQEVNHGS